MIWVACLWNALVSKLSGGESHEGNAKAPRTRTERLADNITRDLLTSGTLRRYIDELSLTGLTSNPTIFDQAIKSSSDYDSAIRGKLKEGKSGESLFFELAIEDLAQAADLFRPTWDRTNGVDGWVSLEVSPLLAHDTASTIAAAKELHARAKRPNLFIKIPGTKGGVARHRRNDLRRRTRECDPVVQPGTLPRCSRGLSAGRRAAHCSRSESKCWLRCIGLRQSLGCRRRQQGSRASYTIKLGIAIAKRTYKTACELLASARSRRIYNEGGRPQRLLWASTGTKRSGGVRRPIHQGAGRAAHGQHHAGKHGEGPGRSRRGWRDVGGRWRRPEEVLSQFAKAGVDVDALAATLQDEGAKSFVKSWNELMGVISAKTEVLKKAS